MTHCGAKKKFLRSIYGDPEIIEVECMQESRFGMHGPNHVGQNGVTWPVLPENHAWIDTIV